MYDLICVAWTTLSMSEWWWDRASKMEGGGGIKASHSLLRILTRCPFARINYSPTSVHPKPRTHPSLPLSTQRMTSPKTPAHTSAWSVRTKDSERLMIHQEHGRWNQSRWGTCTDPSQAQIQYARGGTNTGTRCPTSFQVTEEQAKAG